MYEEGSEIKGMYFLKAGVVTVSKKLMITNTEKDETAARIHDVVTLKGPIIIGHEDMIKKKNRTFGVLCETDASVYFVNKNNVPNF